MSQLALLLGLLVLSYVASMLVTGRTIRGFGLPSGAEYLLLGIVLGPHGLGLVSGALVEAFSPLLVVSAAWIALVAGAGYGQVGQRPVRPRRAIAGIVLGAAVGAAVGVASWFVLAYSSSLGERSHWLLAVGAGALCSETTRHAVRWVVERHGARGELSDTLADHARASVLIQACALGLLFALEPVPGLHALVLPLRALLALVVGVLLGLVALLLLGRDFRRDESWGVLLGTSLLGVGIAARLELSAITTTFFLGLTLAIASPHRSDVKAMVGPTEKPVMLPLAVLAGASVVPESFTLLPWFMALGLVARWIAELGRGAVLSSFVKAARPVGPVVGWGMTSVGAFTLASAVSLKLRFAGEVGDALLTFGCAALLAGELLGPLMLRRALERAGEIAPSDPLAANEQKEAL